MQEQRILDNLILENEDYIFAGNLIINGEVSINNCSLIVSGKLTLHSHLQIKGGDISCSSIDFHDISIIDGNLYLNGASFMNQL